MQLTEGTIRVLQNFATIQDNLVVKPGDVVLTMAEAKNVLASATLDQDFPKEFGIYNLNEFLSVLSLVDKPTIKFEDDFMMITDEVGKIKVKYVYSDPSILTTPPGLPKLTDEDYNVSFTMDVATLNDIRKASSVFGYDKLTVTPFKNNISLSVFDPKNDTSNIFSIEVPGEPGDEPFNLIIDINHLKMIPGEYKVSISGKGLSRFVSPDGNLEYFVALEKSSTYGE